MAKHSHRFGSESGVYCPRCDRVAAASQIEVATLWEAVFADVGVALLAILNASRVLQTREE